MLITRTPGHGTRLVLEAPLILARYMRLERGEAEPWESEERRYDWEAPPESLSDKFTPVGGKEEHRGGPQGGTH